MPKDRLAEIDDSVGVAVNGLADRALQLISAAHSDPSLRLFAASTSQLIGMTQKGQSVAVSTSRWVDTRDCLTRKDNSSPILDNLRKQFR
jgi:hypothetical protein